MGASVADLNRMVSSLEMSGNYRVLERFTPRDNYGVPTPGATVRKVMFVDTETTGLSPVDDVMIELGYVVAEFDAETGAILRVVRKYEGTEDPGRPLSELIVKLTGMTDEVLKGTRFDEQRVNSDLEHVDLVVPHNAGFDRSFLEKRFPAFAGKWFACSHRDVDWTRFGSSSSKLEFLAFKLCGVFYDAHRALVDAQVLLHVMAQDFRECGRPMTELLSRSRLQVHRVWAKGSPLDTKDVLRRAGYAYNGPDGPLAIKSCWFRDTADVDAELAWLSGHVFAPGTTVPVDLITGRERFTTRVAKQVERVVGPKKGEAEGAGPARTDRPRAAEKRAPLPV